MSPLLSLVSFGLRQIVGEPAEMVAKFLVQRFTDHSQNLPKALATANDRAWQTLGIALAGDSLLEKVKIKLASGEEQAFAQQIRLFLNQTSGHFQESPKVRQKCLEELKRARQAGKLSLGTLSAGEVAQQAASFQRYTDPKGLVTGTEQIVIQIADTLVPDFPELAALVRKSTPGGPPLLVVAFAYFLRREVEDNKQLAHGLLFDGLRQLSDSQNQAFEEVRNQLKKLGDKFDQVMDRVINLLRQLLDAVLDMQAELERLRLLHLANADEVRRMLVEVMIAVKQVGMQKGEVKPQHSFSIRNENERQAVRNLLDRFRLLSEEEQKQVPALLNGLGKLQIASGDPVGARHTFIAVATNVSETAAEVGAASVADTAATAEVYYNAYRAALEEKKWDEALQAIQQAASLDSQRFAPFPMRQYKPKRILGAGGFGTAFLCHDCFFDVEVVVKTLHDTALERGTHNVFQEARVLGKLHHPAIIGVRGCSYADLDHMARPYIVMDYFPGGNLDTFIQQRGALSPEHLLSVASQIAQGIHAAHQQNILHRDLKPANLLVRKEGKNWQVKIIDFGLAMRHEAIDTSKVSLSTGHSILSSSVAGTLKYAPPEQLGELPGVKPGRYSDVYAFGKLCCYALFKTTVPVFRHWETVSDNLRNDLKKMLEKCIDDELEHRYANFDPVLKVLEALINQTPDPLPTNLFVDVSGWPARDKQCQWAAKQIALFEKLANEGKWDELEAAKYPLTTSPGISWNPNKYENEVAKAWQHFMDLKPKPDPNLPPYSKALDDLRKALAGFKPGHKDYDAVMPFRDQVLARYKPIFSPGHLPSLSKEEFTSFLYVENNHHWSGLYRMGLAAADDMDKLRSGLGILLDEGKPIQKRLTEALKMVTGVGKGLATAILTVTYPDKYGVWNNTSEDALKKFDLWSTLERGKGIGGRYEAINNLLHRFRSDLGIDFWTLDALWWSLLGTGEGDSETSNKEQVYRLWENDPEGSPDDWHKLVGERVLLSTIKGWISGWKRGKNRPVGVKGGEPVNTTRTPGVIDSIAEFLLAASEQEPLTKEKIVERLAQRFPDRDREKMTVTVNSQLGNRIQVERGLVLSDDGKGGYWANASGNPQPEPVGRDRFGCRLGSQGAQINAVLSSEPKTAQELAKETGLEVSRVKAHLKHWLKKKQGLGTALFRDGDKWFLQEGIKKDRFGFRSGSNLARFNAVLSGEPRTMTELRERAGLKDTFYGHVKVLIDQGFVVKTEDGKYALKEPPISTPDDQEAGVIDIGQLLGLNIDDHWKYQEAEKINAAVTAKPKTADEIMRDSGQSNDRVREHLKWLIDQGFVANTEDGKYVRTPLGQSVEQDESAVDEEIDDEEDKNEYQDNDQ